MSYRLHITKSSVFQWNTQTQRRTIDAVSYTHLDVYKRQLKGGAADRQKQIELTLLTMAAELKGEKK